MICPKCKFDNPAGMTFCGSCGTPLSRLCPSCGFENSLDFTFCGKCGYDLRRPAEAVSALRRGEPQAYTPRHLADKILTTRPTMEGERKQVTVLFADVSGFTSISEKLDPEEVHALMNRCLEFFMDEIHRYEGTVTQFTGDGVMALFGAPIAHEDAPQRGLHAALAIQQALKRYAEELKREQGIEFQMRIGLNTGLVVVGKIGDDLTMEYTAVGDTVNLAARIEQLAEPGTILVAEASQRLTEGYFEFRPLGPVEVKGKAEPVTVYEVVGLGPIRSRIEAAELRGLTKFVGRMPEMEHLMVCYRRVKEGQGQMVGIVGEAGVGKSRLLLEFMRSREGQDFTYLEGRCIYYGETLPYYPFIEIVKRYCGIEDTDREFIYRKKLKERVLGLDPALEDTLPFLEDLLSLKVEDEAFAKMEPEQRRWKTLDAVKTLFIRESQEKPLVLAIEDMHWIDRSSEELLTHFIEGIANARILLLCVYRSEYRHRWGELSYYSRMGVDQLSPPSSTELLQSLLGEGKVADHLKDLILGKAGGNPLFVEEFTRSLLDMGAIARSDDQYVLTRKPSEMEVPDTLQAAIAARIDRQEETLKRVLQVASVIGREFAFRILRIILEIEEQLRSHLAELTGLEFIYEKRLFPELEYMFKHALTQEVAYNSLLIQRRKEFHKRIAQAIEEIYRDKLHEYLGVLAHHYQRAEDWEEALHYLTLSGDRSFSLYSLEESIEHYGGALEVLGRLPNTVENRQRGIDLRFALYNP
ncbi:MAG: adenylate/guanylate cyclase domain-containing protein, partial [Dehalococcoidia bacterium]